MPDNNVTPENLDNAAQDAVDAAANAADTVQNVAQTAAEGSAEGQSANDVFNQLANALAGDNASVPEATTPVQTQPFSDPNKPAEFAQASQFEPVAQQTVHSAAEVQYTQPTQTYDPAQQAAQPAQAYDPAQAQYTQPTQAYDPNQQAYGAQPGAQPYYGQPQYGQAQYGQPAAPQYANGTNPGTTPMVLGILSIVFFGLVGLILAIIGLKKSGPVLAADPNNGRAKAGKITSIIGLVISILSIIFGIALLVITMIGLSAAAENPEAFVETMEQLSSYDETGELQQELDNLKQELGMTEGSTGSTDSAGSEGTVGGSADYDYSLPTTLDAAAFSMKATGDTEADVRALAENVLNAVKNPSAGQKAEIDKYFKEAFENSYGGTPEQFNMTQEEYMNWAAGDFQYKVQDVMGSEDYAWADVTFEGRDWNQFIDLYYDEIMAIPDEEIASLNTDEKRAAKFGEIMKHAMEGTDKVEQIVSVNATKEGDTWKVDQYSVDELFYTLYDLY